MTYCVLKREVRKYSQKVRKVLNFENNLVTVQLNDGIKTYNIDEMIFIQSFIKGDILINSEISTLVSDRFLALGGNHKYTKVLRMSDCMILNLANIEFKKVGNVYENC